MTRMARVHVSQPLRGPALVSVLPVSRVDGWIAAYVDAATFVTGHGEPTDLAAFEAPNCDYLMALETHMDEAVEGGVDLQEAIRSLDRGRWQGLADFDALAGFAPARRQRSCEFRQPSQCR
jgi:hypothetical protein